MTSPRIALIGAGGQLATDLAPRLPGDVISLPHAEIEVTDSVQVAQVLDVHRPDVVINCSGYNLVDKAEDEPAVAFAVNAVGPRNLALECGRRGLTLMHVSSDYVFDGGPGRARPFVEDELPGPVSAYGISKLAGEYFVRAGCPKHFVIRTCGLYGIAATRAKGNFLETMLRLAATRPELKVVNDQRCTPSYTADVAGAMAELLSTDAFGLYHVTNGGAMTWYELACELFRQAGLSVKVIPITSAEFGARARRPAYSVLDCRKVEQLLGRPMPDWPDAVGRYLQARSQSP